MNVEREKNQMKEYRNVKQIVDQSESVINIRVEDVDLKQNHT